MIYCCESNRVRRTYLGGKRLELFYATQNPTDGYYPEDWIASTVEANNIGSTVPHEGLSVCTDGSYLLDHIIKDPIKMLGSAQVKRHGERPSILVKLLDAAERLVIQVHPTVEFAKEFFHSAFGKTECWYIVEADEDAHVYLGFKEGIQKENWMDLFEKQDITGMLSMLHKIPVKPGDLWFVDGGVPHAIGGGCMMVELQEPTDLMVIPERVTPSGNKINGQRLHGGLGFVKMFDCFNYIGMSLKELKQRYYRCPDTKQNQCCPIVDSSLTDKFAMDYYHIKGQLTVGCNQTYCIGFVLSGSGTVRGKYGSSQIGKGSQLFVSADETQAEFESMNGLEVLICHSS